MVFDFRYSCLLLLAACGGTTTQTSPSSEIVISDVAGPSQEEVTDIYAEAREADTSMHSMEIELVESTAARAALVDYGWRGQGASDASLVFYQKAVVLRHTPGGWDIECDESVADGACGLVVSQSAPAAWTALNDWWVTLLAECEGGEDGSPDEFPGLGGSNGCDPGFSFVARLCDGAASECIYAEEAAALGISLNAE